MQEEEEAARKRDEEEAAQKREEEEAARKREEEGRQLTCCKQVANFTGHFYPFQHDITAR